MRKKAKLELECKTVDEQVDMDVEDFLTLPITTEPDQTYFGRGLRSVR